MQNFKAILLDIDRTITNSSGEITEETRSAIRNVVKKGFKVGLCTGRTYPSISSWIKTIFIPFDIHILAGGGQIASTDGDVFWSREIPSDIVKELSSRVEKMGGSFSFVQGTNYFASKNLIERAKKNNPSMLISPIKNPQSFSTPLFYVTDLNDEIKSFIFGQKNLTVKHMISNVSGREYFDITMEGVNKATAGIIWAKKNGVKMQEIIAVGDGENDLEIMEAVGCGVAMGNAVDELKERADKIIDHTDQNGLAVFLNSLK